MEFSGALISAYILNTMQQELCSCSLKLVVVHAAEHLFHSHPEHANNKQLLYCHAHVPAGKAKARAPAKLQQLQQQQLVSKAMPSRAVERAKQT
jgi:hypothetical protein